MSWLRDDISLIQSQSLGRLGMRNKVLSTVVHYTG